MLLGNRNLLGFELRPLAPLQKHRYVPELAAWASFAVWVHNVNLCQYTRPGSDRVTDYVNVPLLPIVEWIAKCWQALSYEERPPEFAASRGAHQTLAEWGDARSPAGTSDDAWVDARERWWGRHFLMAGAEGSHLPNLAFVRQDDELVVSWSHGSLAGVDPPTFLAVPTETSVPWDDAAKSLAELTSHVGTLVEESGLATHFPWFPEDGLHHDQGLDEEALSLFTGRSFGELLAGTGSTDIEAVVAWLGLNPESADPAAAPVPQALRDLPATLPRELWAVLKELDQASGRGGNVVGTWVQMRSLVVDAVRVATSPEEAGQLAATAVRAQLSLDGDPVADTRALLASSGIIASHSSAVTSASRMLVGARLETGAAATVVLDAARTTTEWGRRFEHARALGHILLDPPRGGAIGAASSPFAQATRRRRSGAFAAEFLLPESALLDRTGGDVDATDEELFRGLLADFGVGAITAAQQLYNHHLLSSRSARDELIEAYASAR